MNILITLLLIVEVVVSVLAVLVILAQKSKDQGLGMAFGSGMGESLFGSRAGNVLTRLTVILAAIFMVTTIALGMLYAKKGGGGSTGSIMDDLPVAAQVPAAPAADAGAPLLTGDAPSADAGVVDEPMVFQVGEDGQLEEVSEPVEVLMDEASDVSADAGAAVEAAAEEAPAVVEAVAEEAAVEAAPAEPAAE